MKARTGQGRRAQPDHWFVFARGNGLTGWHVECVLRRYGVAVVGRRYAARSPTVGVKVPGSQALFSEYLLARSGLTAALTTPLLNPKHAQTKIGPLPPAWGRPAKTRGAMGWFVRLLGLSIVGDTAKGMATGSTKRKR